MLASCVFAVTKEIVVMEQEQEHGVVMQYILILLHL